MGGRTVITELGAAEQVARQEVWAAVQAEIANRTKVAEDSYTANKGSEAGLVAFGRLMELRGLAASLSWAARGA